MEQYDEDEESKDVIIIEKRVDPTVFVSQNYDLKRRDIRECIKSDLKLKKSILENAWSSNRPSSGMQVCQKVSAPKSSASFGLTFILRSKYTSITYVGDGQFSLMFLIDPNGRVLKECMQNLERRPWSATFSYDEKYIIIGEVLGILEVFDITKNKQGIPEKVWKIDFLQLSTIKTKIDDDHALSQLINPTTMSIDYAVKKIIMLNQDHALCGLGTAGLLFIINISSFKLVSQANIGLNFQINDMIKIKGQISQYLLATHNGLVIIKIDKEKSYHIKVLSKHLEDIQAQIYCIQQVGEHEVMFTQFMMAALQTYNFKKKQIVKLLPMLKEYILTIKPLESFQTNNQILKHQSNKRLIPNKFFIIKDTEGLYFLDYDTNQFSLIQAMRNEYRLIHDSLSISRDSEGQVVISSNSKSLLSARVSYQLRAFK